MKKNGLSTAGDQMYKNNTNEVLKNLYTKQLEAWLIASLDKNVKWKWEISKIPRKRQVVNHILTTKFPLDNGEYDYLSIELTSYAVQGLSTHQMTVLRNGEDFTDYKSLPSIHLNTIDTIYDTPEHVKIWMQASKINNSNW